MKFSEILKSERKNLKWSQAELAHRCGWEQGRISHYETGRREPSLSDIQSIADAMSISFTKLVSDDQSMYNTEPANMNYDEVPIISWVQAGEFTEAMDLQHPTDTDYETVSRINGGKHVYALRIQGDSMTAPAGVSPSFPEGFIIQVDPMQATYEGDYVIAKVSGHNQATFKQLKSDGGRPYLKPLNPSHPTIFDEFRVLGKVIGATIKL